MRVGGLAIRPHSQSLVLPLLRNDEATEFVIAKLHQFQVRCIVNDTRKVQDLLGNHFGPLADGDFMFVHVTPFDAVLIVGQ